MIRCNIIGFNSSDGGGPRWGDCQIFDDGKYYVVIDGYTGVGAAKLIKRLKKIGAKRPYLYISHAHGDHFDGIMSILKDSYFTPRGLYCYDPASLVSGLSNSEIKSDYNSFKAVIAKARSKGITVKYLKHGDHQKHGDIDFYVYRQQPAFKGNSSDPHGWEFLNHGSLCFWFPKLKYWTSGDGPLSVGDMCKNLGVRPVFFKIPHHGNACGNTQAKIMKSRGAVYCWDNDYSTNYTDFLSTGRKPCVNAGIKFFDIHGDINFVSYGGKVVIYKDGRNYQYACSYKGKSTLKMADLDVVIDTLNNKYGSDDARVTALLDAHWYPSNVQNRINQILKALGD